MSQFRWMSSSARKGEFERIATICLYDLGHFAKALGLSYRQLERYFKRDFGCGPKEWLDKQRVTAAMRKLASETSVKVVAFDLGFRSESHFCSFFRKYTGSSPGEFIRTRVCAFPTGTRPTQNS